MGWIRSRQPLSSTAQGSERPLTVDPSSDAGRLLSLVPTRAMPALAVSVSAAYQATTDLLCLFVSTSPLVQDFAIAVSFIGSLARRAAEPGVLSPPHPGVSLL